MLSILTLVFQMEFKFFYNSLFVMKSLTKFINYSIIQNSKRLQTFPKSQENEILTINPDIFEKATLLQLIKLKDAFSQLAQNHKLGKVDVQLTNLNRLEITTVNGNFILEGRSDLSTLFYTSPLSGTYKYYYDTLQERFYSNKDGHLLDENISRQAQRHFGDILPL